MFETKLAAENRLLATGAYDMRCIIRPHANDVLVFAVFVKEVPGARQGNRRFVMWMTCKEQVVSRIAEYDARALLKLYPADHMRNCALELEQIWIESSFCSRLHRSFKSVALQHIGVLFDSDFLVALRHKIE